MADVTDQIKPMFQKPRQVIKRVTTKEEFEGPAKIRRSIGSSALKYLDPFIFMDFFTVRAPAGFPDHPHRGFEVVTYMLQGASSHEDFAGHRGSIKSGDVQWMTAGRGIVHSEWLSGEGDNVGIQLWINLSSRNKMMEPRYQELESKDITRVEKDGVEVRIIAGESFGVKSPIFTATPTMFLDFTLQPGAHVDQRVPKYFNASIYVLEGEAVIGSPDAPPATSHQALVLGPGDGITAWNKSSSNKPTRFILVGGRPLKEPMVHHGTFVMNTREEVQKASEDYRHYRNGFERARNWRSSSKH